jgi:hypothetical protein
MGYPFSSPNGDEEDLNEQFAGYLYYSLQVSPDLLNRIHSHQQLFFSDEARLVAHQNSPLPRYTDTGINREIDWVVDDGDKLVGYESKYSAPLHKDQLQDELNKLRLNADGRDVALVVITMNTTPVSLLNQFTDEPVYWLSWFTVFRRLHQTDEADIPPEQRPILRMLRDLFEAEDMHPFTGFDHHDKLQYRYFIRDLRQELVGTELENPGKVHTSATKDPEPSAWKRIAPKRIDVPFVRESREQEWSRLTSYLTVTVDMETHDVHTGIVFNLREIKTHRDYVNENIDELIEYAAERDMDLWASMNSFNQWKVGIAKTDDPAEMRTWLADGSENAVRADGTDYKKAIFVRGCSASDPAGLVQEVKQELLELHKQFLISDELYRWPTLEEYE